MSATTYPYLAFENTKKALQYYEQVFGATDIVRLPVTQDQADQFGISTDHLEDKTIHAEFKIAGATIFCSDALMAIPQPSSLISILLDFNEDQITDAQALFDRVAGSETVKVIIPFASQEFGGQLGTVVDQYGVTWMIRVESRTEV